MSTPEKDFENHTMDEIKHETIADGVQMPESLRSMSEGEIAVLERKMVRKIDLVIM